MDAQIRFNNSPLNSGTAAVINNSLADSGELESEEMGSWVYWLLFRLASHFSSPLSRKLSEISANNKRYGNNH